MHASHTIATQSNDLLHNVEKEISRDVSIGKVRHSFARLEAIAQDFTLVNQHGKFINLYDSLEQHSVVINFYSPADNSQVNLSEMISLNKVLSDLNIKHYLISQDQYYLSQVASVTKQLNIDLLHDQNLRIFFNYGLVNSEINTPFELFENKHVARYTNRQHVNAMYLIGTDRRIHFSQLNFSDNSVHKDALVDEILQLNQQNTKQNHESH